MKYLCVLLFTLLAYNGTCQSDKNQNRFSFGLSFSPDYTFRNFSAPVASPWNEVADIEDPRFGFTTGLVAKYQVSNRFAVESGILFSDKGYKMKFDELVYPDETGYAVLDGWVHSYYHYYYLGVPVKGNFYIVDKRVKLFLSAGVFTDFFLDSKIKTEYFLEGEKGSEDNSDENEYFKKVNFGGLAGFGAEYNCGKHIQLRLEPLIRYSFTSAMKDTPLTRSWYSAGINFVVFFKG